METNQRVFSGIQPSGTSHLGTYLGALKNFVTLQDDYETFYCIVDLHALTTPRDPKVLRSSVREIAAIYLAAGLDPSRAVIFRQSSVGEHAELSWLLNCIAKVGELSRMTQFKDKTQRGGTEAASVGLYAYPVLQAADILLYNAHLVPVGEDQRQHIELARTLARRFNHLYGETFVVPEGTYGTVGAKIMDLQEPENRMSTSLSSELGLVRVLDPPDVIRRKVRSAVTDSGRDVVRSEDKPGITNLIEIMAVATGEGPDAIEARYDGAGYGAFKEDVAEAVVELLDPIRLRYGELRGRPAELAAILAAGAEKAHTIAAATLRRAYENVGFVPP